MKTGKGRNFCGCLNTWTELTDLCLRASALLFPLPGFSTHFSMCPPSSKSLFRWCLTRETFHQHSQSSSLSCCAFSTALITTWFVCVSLPQQNLSSVRWEDPWGSLLYQQHLEQYLSLCKCSIKICGINE